MHAADNLAQTKDILRESLRSNRVQACDDERITLSCPRNTQIMVQTGFYGRVVPETQLCPGRHRPPPPSASIIHHHSSTCDVIQAHTRISEMCDKRRKCTVVVDSHTFEDDPCPSTSKYLQMSYACMPVSFDDETFCSSSEVRLECREGRRLAIYAAQMRTSAQCSTPTGLECSTDALPTVLRECHAKESCTISNVETDCKDAHLHLVYMCVNEEIFSEEAIKGELTSLEGYLKNAKAAKAPLEKEEDRWERIVDESPPSPAPSIHMINNDASYVTHDEYRMDPPPSVPDVEPVEPNLIGVGHDVLQIAHFFKQNKEKALTCAVLSISMAAIVVLSACIVKRLCRSGRTTNGSSAHKSSKSRHSLETSRLVSSNYGGTLTPTVHLCDIEDESFMRYSLPGSKPASQHYSHYDF
ncbi:unnamed protein product [Caenorhabditis bovis]|uniref:SUEL-type lectin domain-containing protein n=1 Tax=Caenorhabditis bovis TaxID=2654633 RepID=A0A8S1F1I6_9PELO|nr:unnamed protein product [Caenorhabditis bovis]